MMIALTNEGQGNLLFRLQVSVLLCYIFDTRAVLLGIQVVMAYNQSLRVA